MTGFDAAGINREFFPDGEHRVLAVVNIGKPGPDAWLGRSPRLDYEDVVTVALGMSCLISALTPAMTLALSAFT